MSEAKTKKSEASESKATAEGDLEVTTKALNEDLSALGKLHHDCMSKASEFEEETKSRGEELKALATAKKIIKEATSGAASQSYDFLQLAKTRITSKTDLVSFEAVRFIRDLARKQRSTV